MISRFLLVLFLTLTIVCLKNVEAGGCGTRSCSFPEATQNVQPVQNVAPTTSGSHSFTATGGSRVAEINLSKEAQAVINAGRKEEPLPKGFVSAGDRAKSMAKQTAADERSQDNIDIGRLTKTQPHYVAAIRSWRNSRGVEKRSQTRPLNAARVTMAARAKSEN